jgi:hypothetical protein
MRRISAEFFNEIDPELTVAGGGFQVAAMVRACIGREPWQSRQLMRPPRDRYLEGQWTLVRTAFGPGAASLIEPPKFAPCICASKRAVSSRHTNPPTGTRGT